LTGPGTGLLALLLSLAFALASTSLAAFRVGRHLVFVVRATAAIAGSLLGTPLVVPLVASWAMISLCVVGALPMTLLAAALLARSAPRNSG
jgi:hypothetical protein